ncbi:MAG: hypothetical protein WDA47_05950 [Bacilli bacterium]
MNRELQKAISMVRKRLSQLEQMGDMAEGVEMVAKLIDTLKTPQDIRDAMEATLFMKETNDAEYDALKRVLDKWEKKSGKKSEAKNEEIEISTKEVEKIISREKIKSKTNIDPEEMDRVDLSFIISRRGKEWIKKEINDAH